MTWSLVKIRFLDPPWNSVYLGPRNLFLVSVIDQRFSQYGSQANNISSIWNLIEIQTQSRPHELGPGEKLTNFIKETNSRSILYNTKYLSVVWYYQTNGKSTRMRWRKKKNEYKQKQRDLNISQLNNIITWSGRGGDILVNHTVFGSCNLQH